MILNYSELLFSGELRLQKILKFFFGETGIFYDGFDGIRIKTFVSWNSYYIAVTGHYYVGTFFSNNQESGFPECFHGSL